MDKRQKLGNKRKMFFALTLILILVNNSCLSQNIDNKYLIAITYLQNSDDIFNYLEYLYEERSEIKAIKKQNHIDITISDEVRYMRMASFCKFRDELNYSREIIDKLKLIDKQNDTIAFYEPRFLKLCPPNDITVYFSIPCDSMLMACIANKNNPNNGHGVSAWSLYTLFIFDKNGLIDNVLWGFMDYLIRIDYLRNKKRE